MAGWRILTDIGEVQIQSDEDSIFVQTNIEDLRVRITNQTFVVNAVGIVARVKQQHLRFARKVLVKFETRGHPCG